MPTRDRYWRAKMIDGPVLIVLTITVAIILWSIQLMTFQLSDLLDPYLRTQIIPFILMTLFAAGLFLLLGWEQWRAGLRARTRYRMRVAAMNGQPDAMPLVRRDIARGAPADAPDGLDLTLMLTWRATNSAYRVEIPVFGFIAAVFLAFLGFPVYLVSLIENAAPAHTIPLIWALFLYGVIFVVVAGCLSAALLFIRQLFELRRLHGVVASDEGIMYYPNYRRPRLLRWDDLRLLELAMPKDAPASNPNTYIVYTSNDTAEWSETLRNNAFMAFGAPNDELARRQQALLDLIAARTGLQARSCNRELWEVAGGDAQAMNADEESEEEESNDDGPDEEGASSAQHIVLLVMGVVSALVVLPSAAAIVLVGLTTSSALNALTAVSLLVAYGITVYAATRGSGRRTQAMALGSYDVSGAAPPSGESAAESDQKRAGPATKEASGAYGLVFGATTRTQLGFGAVGLALTLCVFPGLSAAIGDQARRYTPTSALAMLPTVQGTGVHGALASAGMLVLFALGVIGALFLAGSLPFRRTVVVADMDGLRWRQRRETRRLAWREIASIEARVSDGRLDTYAATNSDASVTITWYADAYTARPLTPRDLRRIGAPTQSIQPIMPRALATLVQERSGVALTHGEQLSKWAMFAEGRV